MSGSLDGWGNPYSDEELYRAAVDPGSALRRVLEDPLFSVAVLEYQIATGRVRNSCMEPARLGTDMIAVALEVEGGWDADREVQDQGACNLLGGHRGSHYTMVRELGEGYAVWMKWRRNLARLQVMRDCGEKSANGEDICYLFLGHREPHSWDWARWGTR